MTAGTNPRPEALAKARKAPGREFLLGLLVVERISPQRLRPGENHLRKLSLALP
jgi:hypothetical protein